jgi:hypothetical protein
MQKFLHQAFVIKRLPFFELLTKSFTNELSNSFSCIIIWCLKLSLLLEGLFDILDELLKLIELDNEDV